MGPLEEGEYPIGEGSLLISGPDKAFLVVWEGLAGCLFVEVDGIVDHPVAVVSMFEVGYELHFRPFLFWGVDSVA